MESVCEGATEKTEKCIFRTAIRTIKLHFLRKCREIKGRPTDHTESRKKLLLEV